MDFDTVVLLYHHNLKGYSDSKRLQSKVNTPKVSVSDCLLLYEGSRLDLSFVTSMLQIFSGKSACIRRLFLYLWRVISLIRLLADIVLEAFGFIPFVVNLGNSTYNRNDRETLPLGRYICTLTYKCQGSEPFPSSIIRALRVKAYHKG